MEVGDWRCVSQASILALIEKAVVVQKMRIRFNPSIVFAASEDALSVCRTLKAVLKEHAEEGDSETDLSPTILTSSFERYDEENPYNPVIRGAWSGSFSEAKVLVVDKADNSRTSLQSAIAVIKAHIDEQKAAAGTAWGGDAQIGVFVLHNKRRPKAADLPAEVMDGRYFACEETDNVAISYPFHVTDETTPVHQPTAHGDHPHLGGGAVRTLSQDSKKVHQDVTPCPVPGSQTTVRVVSQPFVHEAVKRAIAEHGIMDKFIPSALVAVSEDSIPIATILLHHLRTKLQHPIPVVTCHYQLYDEAINPYQPIMGTWSPSSNGGSISLSGQRLLLVERVDSSRATLTSFLAGLKSRINTQRAAIIAEGKGWVETEVAVFVLFDKMIASKEEEGGHVKPQLPAEVKHYFVAETSQSDEYLMCPSG